MADKVRSKVAKESREQAGRSGLSAVSEDNDGDGAVDTGTRRPQCPRKRFLSKKKAEDRGGPKMAAPTDVANLCAIAKDDGQHDDLLVDDPVKVSCPIDYFVEGGSSVTLRSRRGDLAWAKLDISGTGMCLSA
ncbi:MAG: hypothetical protein Q9169_002456 [Polycauliona sp. 2 TL-2023]